jgi:hypothetical protein
MAAARAAVGADFALFGGAMLANLRILGLAAIASLIIACVVQDDHSPPPQPGYVGGGPSSGGSSGSGAGGGQSASPILVDVDNDKTMNAAPGDGVGVFIEYGTGGHWHVWWTCDTNVNTQGALTCDFTIRATVTDGAITVVKDQTPKGATRLTGTPTQELDAVTTTGAEVHGVYFDAKPGAVITLEAQIGGQEDGRYFFFVQNGQVNGGFAGTLTDPLMLEGAKP